MTLILINAVSLIQYDYSNDINGLNNGNNDGSTTPQMSMSDDKTIIVLKR